MCLSLTLLDFPRSSSVPARSVLPQGSLHLPSPSLSLSSPSSQPTLTSAERNGHSHERLRQNRVPASALQLRAIFELKPLFGGVLVNLNSDSSDLLAAHLCGAELHEGTEGLQPAGASHPLVLLPCNLQHFSILLQPSSPLDYCLDLPDWPKDLRSCDLWKDGEVAELRTVT